MVGVVAVRPPGVLMLLSCFNTMSRRTKATPRQPDTLIMENPKTSSYTLDL